MMVKRWVLAACVAVLAPVAVAGGATDDAIEFRQGVFRALEWNFKEMGAMVQGRKAFDAERFALQAQRVAALAQMPGEGFIKGSEKGDEVQTRAGAKLWYQREHFDRLLQQLAERSAELAVQAAQQPGRDALRPYFAKVAQTCKGCHDDYRERF